VDTLSNILSVYIPMDRRQALAHGRSLPDRTQGAALFADISGFTALTESLVNELGPQRGADELTVHLNRVFTALIDELHAYGGSVISFGGDALLCWFDADNGLRAVTCALAMQRALGAFVAVKIPSGKTVSLVMKVAVAVGPARRFVVGDPRLQIMDVLVGTTFNHLAIAANQAQRGEVMLDGSVGELLGDQVEVESWRVADNTDRRCGVLKTLRVPVDTLPWPSIPPGQLSEDQLRPWVLPQVYNRLQAGHGDFLAELRPAVALFLRFGDLDYDRDETAGEKLNAYICEVQRTFAQYDGALLQINIGDKGSSLYASFGAPLAHEDDAQRAVLAALDLRVSALPFTFDFQIGISQGLMWTGAYGSAACRTYSILGDEVNLAARLMQAADFGQILVSKTIRQNVGDQIFNWAELPPIEVRGKAGSIEVASPIKRINFHIPEWRYALPMIGRKNELVLIGQKLDQALAGHGQILAVTGEAGLGKSRLIAEAVQLAREKNILGYGGECESYGTSTSYLVWRSIWEDFFELNPGWSLDEKIRFLENRLTQIDPLLTARLPLLGDILNLAIPDNELTQAFDPKLRKDSRESLLVTCLQARAARTPILIVLEDCHWLDPLSYDLLEAIGRATLNLPVFLLMAYRPPELDDLKAPRTLQLPNRTEIALGNFEPAESALLIQLKLKQVFDIETEPPPELIARITERSEGNPFYIEELLNYLRDRNINPSDVAALTTLDMPNSLRSLILSRIDQLTESQKSTLKVASVVGRLFRAAVLWNAYPQLGDVSQILEDLNFLSRIELTLVDSEPELTYLFRHIVTHEVSYESLPYATRAFLHGLIAEYIEQAYGQNLEQWIYLLAFHYGHSENQVKRREYFLKAGATAQATYANLAALEYYQGALPLLVEAERIATTLQIGQVLTLIGEWPKAGEHYQQALDLAEQLGDQHAKARSETAMGELLRKQGKYTEALNWLDRARVTFENLNDEAGIAQTLHVAGSLAAQQGQYEIAKERYTTSLTIRRKLGDTPRIASLLGNLGIVARYEGDNAKARQLREESLVAWRESGDKWGISSALNNLGNIVLDQGDFALARHYLEEALSMDRQIGDRSSIANALNNLGNVMRTLHEFSTAQALYKESLSISLDLDDKWAVAYALEDAGQMYALSDQAELAFRLVGAADAIRDEIGSPRSSAEQAKLNEMLQRAAAALDEASRKDAVASGRSTPLPQMIDFILKQT